MLTNCKVVAGRPDQVVVDADWIFVDMGFASEGNPSCGVLFGCSIDADPQELSYGAMRRAVVEHCRRATEPVNLVIEAPLSVAFDANDNPIGRRIERREGFGPRYWYFGLACGVMVAALHLVRDIAECGTTVEIRLFEGFVSFKDAPSTHSEDVRRLARIVREQFPGSIIAATDLADGGEIESAFKVARLDIDAPAVLCWHDRFLLAEAAAIRV